MDRKEAIKIVRGLYEKSLFLKKDKEAIETLIPEIKDDEDERIRKEMIEYFSQYKEDGLRGVDITPWIAYLERQKEPHYTKRNEIFETCVENCDPKVIKEVADRVDEMLQKEQKSAGQDYSGLSEFERAIHRGFLCAGVENVPIGIIKDTAAECLGIQSVIQPHWKPREDHFQGLRRGIMKVEKGSDAWNSLTDLYEQLEKL